MILTLRSSVDCHIPNREAAILDAVIRIKHNSNAFIIGETVPLVIPTFRVVDVGSLKKDVKKYVEK